MMLTLQENLALKKQKFVKGEAAIFEEATSAGTCILVKKLIISKQ